MRIQKFLIISLVIGSGVGQAISQEAASNAQQKGKSEDFFRARRAEPIRIAAAESEDPLVELLRKKQSELDAKDRKTPVTPARKPDPAVKPAPPVAKPAPVAPVTPKPPVVQRRKPVSQPSVDAQGEERLLELLRKKQAELDATGGAKVSPATPVAKPAPSAAPKTEPRVAKPARTIPTVPSEAPKRVVVQPRKPVSQPAVGAEGEERLVELLRKKQAELDVKAGIVTPAPVTPEPVAKPAEVKKPESKKPAVATQPSKKEKEQEESAARIKRIEAELKAKEEAAKKSAAKVSVPEKKQEPAKTVVASKEAKTSKKTSAQAPAPALDSKEAKLAELLRKYKADEITPHDYHMERAKIVAQP